MPRTPACSCAADWAAGHLTAGQGESDVVLTVDETGGARSPAGCAGAARQYGGTLGGVALCQVAVTLACASPAGHALIGRALYLPADWAAGQERRELAGVPEEVMPASRPRLADGLLQHAHGRGIRAGFVAGDEVYGGLDLRKGICRRGFGYVMAVRSNHTVTLPSGRRLTVKNAAKLVEPGMWQRMRTGQAAKGGRDYHWAMTEITPDGIPPRARSPPPAPPPLHRHRQLLPVLDPAPGHAGQARRRRRRPPARPRRQRRRTRAHLRHRPRAAATPPRNRHPRTPPRQAPP